MEEGADVFKPPPMPPPTSASHVAFKMPPPKKLADSTVDTPEDDESKPLQEDPARVLAAGKDEKAVNISKSEKIESMYKPPVWSGACTTASYDLDVLKDGRIVGSIFLAAAGDNEEQTKPFYIFGRQGDVVVEHPSISRQHAVIQYRSLGETHEMGWYLYDLGSTHGTYLNKEKIPPFMHVRIRVGHMFKLGFSTRLYILNGPDEDTEPESGLSVTEIKERAQKQKLLMSKREDPLLRTIKEEADKDLGVAVIVKDPSVKSNVEEGAAPDSGIDWGMSDDFGEEDDKQNQDDEDGGESAMETIEQIQKREQFYVDDPRKALKNFFDRQNAADEMQFVYTERGTGSRHQWTCRIELPIEAETGRSVFAEATVSGGKKEATVACALEACRILDSAGVLRNSNQDGKKRKSKEWAENDYYDSDEDTFLDRTGDVEKKRAKRMRQVAETENDDGSKKSVETYDTLQEKLRDVNAEIDRSQRQIDLIKAEASQEDVQADVATSSNKDSLDAYMATMSQRDAQEAKIRQSRLRLKLIELKKSAERLEKLIKLAKPAYLPPVTVKKALDSDPSSKKQPVLIGTMKGHRIRKLVAPKQNVEEEKVDVRQIGCSEKEVVEMEEEEQETRSEERVNAVKEATKSGDESSSKLASEKSTIAVKSLNDERTSSDVSKVTVSPPPDGDGSVDQREDRSDDAGPSKQTKRQQTRQRQRKQKGATLPEKDTMEDYDPTDINFAVWLPPENQSGDGRTSLNEKFGY